jgi:negative regulator of flagellin synthesis FlgM
MKIGPLEPKACVAPVGGERSPAAAAPAKPASVGQEESAKVELSSTALTVTEGNADFDAEKVQRIAQAIRDGKYEVNAEAIADKLIANARELLDRSSR